MEENGFSTLCKNAPRGAILRGVFFQLSQSKIKIETIKKIS